ncbi:MAG: 2-oxoacid:acceptor oxidoreductase subunit alpha [Candidatus Brocadiia bacterium]|nr:MAG: 2-oxoacid:acceptor oxidoreductase subunit alpha [Candidatus Brocadiia bacterium]
MTNASFSKDISIVLCGEAGQGIQTVEFLLTRIMKLCGFNVYAAKEYMSRVRGGQNSTEIRISGSGVNAFVDRIDILAALNKGALQHVQKRISPQTLILAEKQNVPPEFDNGSGRFFDTPFTAAAIEIGDKLYSNMIAVGVLAGILKVDLPVVAEYVKTFFVKKADDVVRKNITAVTKGYDFGLGLIKAGHINIDIQSNEEIKNDILINGAQAVSLGAVAGGCNFITSYPMSPSTAVLVFLSSYAESFGIVAEQAEDEIAAINMAIGAWYAGARAMVTTSGGGFALMTEGVSLSAMLETPVVIHLAQRPGPATGLPTRTEQGDLELALYAGHGEFPRILLSPGSLEQAFDLSRRAFALADKYQSPVFILTDQYFIDSYYNIKSLDLSKLKIEKHIIEAPADYKRYELTDNGISPRGVPGFGKGLVCVDSDEHDEEGHITEDLDLRVSMVDKRLKKLLAIKNDEIPPMLIGPEEYNNLVICWGSTLHPVEEALKILNRDGLAMLHFSWIYPLPDVTAKYLEKAQKVMIVENNATSQFAKLIRLCTGFEIENKILKYNGLNFTVEELVEKIGKILDEG